MRTALVTGGAGYIGTHLSLTLKRAGWTVMSFDAQAPYMRSYGSLVGDILNPSDMEYVGGHRFDAIFHMAALIDVEESGREPERYRAVNTGGTANLLREYSDTPIIFSSTAAVYQTSDIPLREDSPLGPSNVYGETKLAAEELIRANGNPHAILRYFNVAGCSPGLRDNHKTITHLIPKIIESGGRIPIYGTDYPTRDGTAVRDYVHVQDICDAHVRAAERLLVGQQSFTANLGSGNGYSVTQVLEAARKVFPSQSLPTIEARRPGDSPSLVADITRASEFLDFSPKYSLEEMIRSHTF